jgi:hypothetical protein
MRTHTQQHLTIGFIAGPEGNLFGWAGAHHPAPLSNRTNVPARRWMIAPGRSVLTILTIFRPLSSNLDQRGLLIDGHLYANIC